MVSFRFCKENKIDYYRMLADFDFSRGVWDKICEKPEKMEKFVLDWFSYFAGLIPAKCFLAISQYPSRPERELGFFNETKLCAGLLKEVSGILKKKGFSEKNKLVKAAFEDTLVKKQSVLKPDQWKLFVKTS